MTTKEKPNYFAILTADVRYSKKINANEKLLFAEITALSSSSGICWASNKHFAELFDCTPQAISKWIKNLENNGFISVKYTYKSGSKEIERREISCVNVRLTGINSSLSGINNDLGGINHSLGGYQHTFKDNTINSNNINSNNINNNKKEKELDFLSFRETSFFKMLTNYFGKTKESQQIPMSSFLNNLFINDKLEEFKNQTLAYIEYKSIKQEASHKWETYQIEWEKTDYVHLLRQLKKRTTKANHNKVL